MIFLREGNSTFLDFFLIEACYLNRNDFLHNINCIYIFLFIQTSPLMFFHYRMVTDVQLAIFANMLGVSLFLLVVLYHYVAVNNPKKQE